MQQLGLRRQQIDRVDRERREEQRELGEDGRIMLLCSAMRRGEEGWVFALRECARETGKERFDS